MSTAGWSFDRKVDGQRFLELAALRVRRLDLARRRAPIAQSVTVIQGQGARVALHDIRPGGKNVPDNRRAQPAC